MINTWWRHGWILLGEHIQGRPSSYVSSRRYQTGIVWSQPMLLEDLLEDLDLPLRLCYVILCLNYSTVYYGVLYLSLIKTYFELYQLGNCS